MPLFNTRKGEKKVKVVFANGLLFVEKEGGHQQALPLEWYPKLKDATEEQRADWTQTDKGIRFNQLDIEVEI